MQIQCTAGDRQPTAPLHPSNFSRRSSRVESRVSGCNRAQSFGRGIKNQSAINIQIGIRVRLDTRRHLPKCGTRKTARRGALSVTRESRNQRYERKIGIESISLKTQHVSGRTTRPAVFPGVYTQQSVCVDAHGCWPHWCASNRVRLPREGGQGGWGGEVR